MFDKKKYQREWRNNKKDSFFEGKQCSACNTTKNLELYHVGGKRKDIKDIWTRRKEVAEEYISECIILCGKCRRKKVQKLISNVIHGSSNTYKNGCRCALCRKASALYQRRLRNAKITGKHNPGNVVVRGAWCDIEGRKK